MWLDRDGRTWLLPLLLALAASGVLLLVLAPSAHGARRARAPAEPVVTRDTVQAPIVRDTPANLREAFENEVNAKERYLAYARQAEREGFDAVAMLFRACATAESVHARRHVEAIAVTGGTARAVLAKEYVSTTAENLRAAIDGETYEVDHWYPALLEKARAEHWPEATRSIVGARSAEREHLRLLSDALGTLESRPAPIAYYVCSSCGKTLLAPPRAKCPNCFSPARRFQRIGPPAPAAPLAQAPAEPARDLPLTSHSRVR